MFTERCRPTNNTSLISEGNCCGVMGRRKSDVWIHFKEVKIDGTIRAKCAACADTVVANRERMAKHWKSCVTANSTDPELSPPKKLKQTTVDKTFSEKDHKIELQSERYFIASNSSFLKVENKEFEKLIRILRPGARIPNRKKLDGPILDELYEQEKEKVKKVSETARLP